MQGNRLQQGRQRKRSNEQRATSSTKQAGKRKASKKTDSSNNDANNCYLHDRGILKKLNAVRNIIIVSIMSGPQTLAVLSLIAISLPVQAHEETNNNRSLRKQKLRPRERRAVEVSGRIFS